MVNHFQGLTVKAISSIPEENNTNTQESALHFSVKLFFSNAFNLQCSLAEAVKSSLVCTCHT